MHGSHKHEGDLIMSRSRMAVMSTILDNGHAPTSKLIVEVGILKGGLGYLLRGMCDSGLITRHKRWRRDESVYTLTEYGKDLYAAFDNVDKIYQKHMRKDALDNSYLIMSHSRMVVMSTILENGQSTTSELMAKLRIQKAGLSFLLRDMCDAGLMTRHQRYVGDVSTYILTEYGRELYAAFYKVGKLYKKHLRKES
ncbi:MAG: winged helix-turn-helix transcriptional regulator [Candidatus Micrarchaeota archaeon]|nr:winged helix-turn-helix transcriptional regulator [Candidatus Micrarchaeota archaeon]